MRRWLTLAAILLLSGCASDRHFATDTLWPFGNPNAPPINSETAQRALGRAPDVVPIAPQPGNVWPGPVQPVPTIADTEANMKMPLGSAYTPSLPSPYAPGQKPDTGEDEGVSPPAAPAPPAANGYSVPAGAKPVKVPPSGSVAP